MQKRKDALPNCLEGRRVVNNSNCFRAVLMKIRVRKNNDAGERDGDGGGYNNISYATSALPFRTYGRFSIAYTDFAKHGDHTANGASYDGALDMDTAWALASASVAPAGKVSWAGMAASVSWVAWAASVASALQVVLAACKVFVVFPCFHFLHL
ncbi:MULTISPECIES: hypothetical protein [Laceyella]|uniref:hypothetical protein n=1 Tax=Laceyella TaxID=292635 RepID=UPI0011B27A2C|nr:MULTISPECIES: hypothetical protein [Laceyella]